ncbi:MAG: sigma-70 family RNA polymerase sigma factor [Candidatus Thorarchaeota archaeon]
MTIEERNEIAMAYTKILYKILYDDFKEYDQEELFQIGFLAILKAISTYKKKINIDNDPDFRAYVAAHIRNNLKWAIVDEYRKTHIDNNILLDLYIPEKIKDESQLDKIFDLLNKLMSQCLTYAEINLIKLYYGFDGKSRSLKDIAEIMHCTRACISLKLKKAINKLKFGNSNKQRLALKKELLKELKEI